MMTFDSGASPAATDPDLRALPDRCYIAEHSVPAKVRFKKILLEDGFVAWLDCKLLCNGPSRSDVRITGAIERCK
jgi:hypothetical protein